MQASVSNTGKGRSISPLHIDVLFPNYQTSPFCTVEDSIFLEGGRAPDGERSILYVLFLIESKLNLLIKYSLWTVFYIGQSTNTYQMTVIHTYFGISFTKPTAVFCITEKICFCVS